MEQKEDGENRKPGRGGDGTDASTWREEGAELVSPLGGRTWGLATRMTHRRRARDMWSHHASH